MSNLKRQAGEVPVELQAEYLDELERINREKGFPAAAVAAFRAGYVSGHADAVDEDSISKALQSIQTLYLISDGFRHELETVANAMDTPEDQTIIRECLFHRLDAMDFLIGVLQEALE